jgi:hypothetical protein
MGPNNLTTLRGVESLRTRHPNRRSAPDAGVSARNALGYARDSAPCPGPAIGLRPDLALIDPGYATRSEKARVTAAVRLETSSLS